MQAIVGDIRHKLLKTNTKYKEATNRNHLSIMFNKGDKMMTFLHKERFLLGLYNKL